MIRFHRWRKPTVFDPDPERDPRAVRLVAASIDELAERLTPALVGAAGWPWAGGAPGGGGELVGVVISTPA